MLAVVRPRISPFASLNKSIHLDRSRFTYRQLFIRYKRAVIHEHVHVQLRVSTSFSSQDRSFQLDPSSSQFLIIVSYLLIEMKI